MTPCGDGALNPGETCDDGNVEAGDGCDGMCRLQTTTTTSSTTSTTTSTTSTTSSTSSTSSTSTTSTSTTSTTSSTLPRPVERCGNCLDDDENGLVDLADPACCVAEFLSVAEARVTPSRLAITANLFGEALPAGDVRLQLQLGSEVVCAQVPAAAFTPTRSGRRFTDERGLVASAAGIDRMRFRQRRRSQREVVVAAEPSPLAPGPGALAVMVALIDGPDMRCAAGSVPLRAGRKVLRYP